MTLILSTFSEQAGCNFHKTTADDWICSCRSFVSTALDDSESTRYKPSLPHEAFPHDVSRLINQFAADEALPGQWPLGTQTMISTFFFSAAYISFPP